MPSRIFVTGLGFISGLGNNVQENLTSLLNFRSGIGLIRHIETILRDELLVSEVPMANEELRRFAGMPVMEACSRNTLLGIIAAREAFLHAGLNDHPGLRIGLISGTTVGGMDQCEKYYQDFLNNDSKNAFIDTYDCADSTEKIADFLGLKGFITTISTACSSAANSIMFAARMMRAGKLEGQNPLQSFTLKVSMH